MGRRYKNPPIVEAVCEFRFPSSSQWDLTIPGLIYDKIKADFPHKKQVLGPGIIEFTVSEGIGHHVDMNKLIQFSCDDKSRLVQVGSRLVSVNCLRPYPTWGRFKPLIEKIHGILLDVIEENHPERLGLRFVNRIIIPERKIELEDYFEFRPYKGNNLPEDMVGFQIGCVFPFSDTRDLCKVLLQNIPTSDPSCLEFHLDFDYSNRIPQSISFQQTLEWVETAHQRIEEIFEGCITEKLRKLFLEVE